jgi:monoamine oxidase
VSNEVSRRDFLNLIAALGGSSALIQAGTALGLMPGAAQAAEFNMPVGSGNGKSAVILGAGISGLCAAYELMKAGYQVTVLEASHRAGGRVMTVRHGDLIDEIGNRQYCEFDDEPHMYFNAGAARIPSTHKHVLDYCEELGVELEVFVNENKSAYFQDDNMLGGKPIRNGEFSTHVRGFLAELFAKNFNEAELSQSFSRSEMETLIGVLRSFGDLDGQMKYTGSLRAGYAKGGFLEHGTPKEVIALKELVQGRFMREALTANEGETGPILMQPVGGMDMIIKGFLRPLGERVQYRAMVRSVQVGNDRVSVAYEQNGERHNIEADYCFNCIPSHLMTGIPNNFPSDYLEAMSYIRRGEAYKAAFQAKTRFWEKEGIYGGISWINAPIRQVWYPPHGIHKAKGVVLAAYDYGGGMHFTNMSQEERLEAAMAQGEKIHPNYRQQVEKGITIAWHRMNHMLGCSARWPRDFRSGWTHHEESLYHRLQQSVNGRHYFIGDQVSQHSAWQESAILSTHWALKDMLGQQQNQALNGQPNGTVAG